MREGGSLGAAKPHGTSQAAGTVAAGAAGGHLAVPALPRVPPLPAARKVRPPARARSRPMHARPHDCCAAGTNLHDLMPFCA